MIETTHTTADQNTIWLYQIVYQTQTMRWFLTLFMLWMMIHPGLLFANGTSSSTHEAVESSVGSETPSSAVPSEVVNVEEPSAVDLNESEIVSEEDVTVVASATNVSTPPDTQVVDAETNQPEREISDTETAPESQTASTSSNAEDVENYQNVTATTSAAADIVTGDETVSADGSSSESTAASSSGDNQTEEEDSIASVTASERDHPSVRESGDAAEDSAQQNQPPAQGTADDDTVPNSDAGTTTETTAESAAISYHQVTTNDNFFQFSRDECARVRDGSYYCGVAEAVVPAENRFYVALDADGDREVFAQRGGKTIQITSNRYDDAAPYYDAVSNSLVWHALVNGRYQIMSYDFVSEDITQLTSGNANSMEPTRFGNITAWQQWGETSWDIAIATGDEVQLITSDTVSDIAPSVHDGIVTWKRMYADGQQLAVYNLESREITEVSDGGLGGTVANARMMLVFESVQPNGDRIMQGFDPVLNELVPLTANSVPLPEKLPTSEPTEEVRALIQAKAPVEEEIREHVHPGTTPPATGVASSSTSSTTTNGDTFDLFITPTATTSSSSESAPPVVDASDVVAATSTYDLVIPPFASSSSEGMGYDE